MCNVVCFRHLMKTGSWNLGHQARLFWENLLRLSLSYRWLIFFIVVTCPKMSYAYLIPVSNDLRNQVSLSRYCIERVFRPRKLDRFHPKELLECAFDIVTSTTNSSLPTAEVIYTIYEIIQEFPALQVPFCILTFWGSPTRVLPQAWGGAPPAELHPSCADSESLSLKWQKSLMMLLLNFTSGSYLGLERNSLFF